METIIKLLEIDSLKTALYIGSTLLCIYIIYYIFLKKHIDEALQDIKNFGKTVNTMKNTLKGIAFMTLQDMFYTVQRDNQKSINEDERFKELWKYYIDLGDGNGDTLLKEWEKIPIK